VVAELAGGVLGFLVIKALYPGITAEEAAGVVVRRLPDPEHDPGAGDDGHGRRPRPAIVRSRRRSS
jgi:hypothetical protein